MHEVLCTNTSVCSGLCPAQCIFLAGRLVSVYAGIVIVQYAWEAHLLAKDSEQQVDEAAWRCLCTGCAEYAGSQGEALQAEAHSEQHL